MSESRVDRNFVLQQGFEDAAPASCSMLTPALLFQPRIVAFLVLLGTILQSPGIFAVLWALLWWSAALPRRNPFEALYHATRGRRTAAVRLGPAPAPRRFAQALAGLLAISIAMALASGHHRTAHILEAVLLVAVAALVTIRFCLGSFLFHLLRGRFGFALRTLPWSRGGEAAGHD
jgi:hypothetical protein